MKYKSFLQIFLIIFIFFISYIFYQSYLQKNVYVEEINTDDNLETINDEKIINESENNLVLNLEYKSIDTFGNEYQINSKKAERPTTKSEELKLSDVSAVIYLVGKSPIFINSDYALHDNLTFNTNFYENVEIKHDDIFIDAENLDLLYEDNIVRLSNIKSAFNKEMELKADKIVFNLLTRDVSVVMNEKSQKINIIYK
tara:strand:- start:40 stop:636 length:597 start_codon:yes stop_codon:yes gene_type:complete